MGSNRSLNPFWTKGEIWGKISPVLIDTGSDVSLIPRKLLNIDAKELSKYDGKVSSVTGDELEISGKL